MDRPPLGYPAVPPPFHHFRLFSTSLKSHVYLHLDLTTYFCHLCYFFSLAYCFSLNKLVFKLLFVYSLCLCEVLCKIYMPVLSWVW